MPILDDMTADIDRACIDRLGEVIEYAADGTAFSDVNAYVDYRDMAKAFEGAKAIEQDVTVTVLKVDVPTKPPATARLRLARLAGKTFKPVSPRSDDSGTHWEMEIAQVPNA